MEIYFFIEWFLKHGKDNYDKIAKKVCENASIPVDIMMKEPIYQTAYRFKYFYITYIIAALQYFNLDEDQVSFIIAILLETEEYKSINPREILEFQKEVISDMKEYINKDFEEFMK